MSRYTGYAAFCKHTLGHYLKFIRRFHDNGPSAELSIRQIRSPQVLSFPLVPNMSVQHDQRMNSLHTWAFQD